MEKVCTAGSGCWWWFGLVPMDGCRLRRGMDFMCGRSCHEQLLGCNCFACLKKAQPRAFALLFYRYAGLRRTNMFGYLASYPRPALRPWSLTYLSASQIPLAVCILNPLLDVQTCPVVDYPSSPLVSSQTPPSTTTQSLVPPSPPPVDPPPPPDPDAPCLHSTSS